MELFRTIVKENFIKSLKKASYHSSFLILGSCFAENIGNKLRRLKFDAILNPFGIIYNPLTIAQSIDRIISGKAYTSKDLMFHDGLWISLDHHGRFSHPDANIVLQQINYELFAAYEQIQKANYLMITFGTAWAYHFKDSRRVVANCHKIPSSEFERTRLEINEICSVWEKTIASLKTLNPNLNFLFTVSPIRHLRDGAHENQLSKSVLLLAVDSLCKRIPNTAYFPAYELLLDELRDYRFYDEDMIHPNHMAVNYIWERFCNDFFGEEDREYMKQIDDLLKAVEHRPLHYTEKYNDFLVTTLEKVKIIQSRLPMLDFSNEQTYITEKLNSFHKK